MTEYGNVILTSLLIFESEATTENRRHFESLEVIPGDSSAVKSFRSAIARDVYRERHGEGGGKIFEGLVLLAVIKEVGR